LLKYNAAAVKARLKGRVQGRVEGLGGKPVLGKRGTIELPSTPGPLIIELPGASICPGSSATEPVSGKTGTMPGTTPGATDDPPEDDPDDVVCGTKEPKDVPPPLPPPPPPPPGVLVAVLVAVPKLASAEILAVMVIYA